MKAVQDWIAVHRKLIVAIVGAGITLATLAWGTENVWVSFAILAATSLGVYEAPNAPAPGQPVPAAPAPAAPVPPPPTITELPLGPVTEPLPPLPPAQKPPPAAG